MMEKALTLSDVVTPVSVFSTSDPLSKVASYMVEEEQIAVPVVSPSGKYAGILSFVEIISSRLHPHTKLKSLIVKVPPLSVDCTLDDAIKMLLKTGVPAVACINSDRKLLGIINPYTILDYAFNGDSKVLSREIMLKLLAPLFTDDPVDKARKFMAKRTVEYLPVLSKKKVEGVIGIWDIIALMYTISFKKSKRGEIGGELESLLSSPIGKYPLHKLPLEKADSQISLKEIRNGVIVVSRDETWPVGIITPITFFKKFIAALEEERLPVIIEGMNRLTVFERSLIMKKAIEIAKRVNKRGRLLELSLVIKAREKPGVKLLYESTASIKLDKGVHSGHSINWDPVTSAHTALREAYHSFTKFKARRREVKISKARLRKK